LSSLAEISGLAVTVASVIAMHVSLNRHFGERV
jgi:hypothetical protein